MSSYSSVVLPFPFTRASYSTRRHEVRHEETSKVEGSCSVIWCNSATLPTMAKLPPIVTHDVITLISCQLAS